MRAQWSPMREWRPSALDALLLAFVVASAITVSSLPAIVVLVCMGAVAGARLARDPRRIDPLIALILANEAYWFISAFLLAAVPLSNLLAYQFWRWDGRIFIYYLPFIFFLSVPVSLATARRALACALVFSAVVALLGAAQFTFDISLPFGIHLVETGLGPPGEGTNPVRLFTGFQASHDVTGTYYGLIALTWAVLAVSLPDPELPMSRPLLMVLLGCVFVAFVLAVSRAAYAGLAAALIYQSVRWVRRGWSPRLGTLALVGVAAVAVAVGASASVRARLDVVALGRLGHTSGSDYDVSGRIREWRQTLPLIWASPIIGIGFSRWNDVLEDSPVSPDAGLDAPRFHGLRGLFWLARDVKVLNADVSPHSSYVLRWSEIGAVGVALLACFWLVVWRRLRVVARATQEATFPAALACAAEVCIVFVAVEALFNDAFGAPGEGFPLALIAGLALATAHQPPSHRATERRDIRKGMMGGE